MVKPAPRSPSARLSSAIQLSSRSRRCRTSPSACTCRTICRRASESPGVMRDRPTTSRRPSSSSRRRWRTSRIGPSTGSCSPPIRHQNGVSLSPVSHQRQAEPVVNDLGRRAAAPEIEPAPGAPENTNIDHLTPPLFLSSGFSFRCARVWQRWRNNARTSECHPKLAPNHSSRWGRDSRVPASSVRGKILARRERLPWSARLRSIHLRA